MKRLTKLCFVALILTGSAGCTVDKHPVPETTVDIQLSLSAEGWQTRAFTNDPVSHSVDRILVMPFLKTGPDNEPTSFTPVTSQIMQYDVSVFEYEASLKLLRGETYKIMVLGYNSADYDQNNLSGGGNKFEVLMYLQPPTLRYLILRLLEQTPGMYDSCEIFSGFARVGGSESFVPTDDMAAVCVLQRLQGGFSLELTDVPANVESITLNASQFCSAVALYDGIPYSVSGFSDTPLATATPPADTVTFDIYLIPYGDPEFSIEIVYTDATTVTYPVTATDSETGETFDNFPTVANRAYNLSGSYNDFKFEMDIGSSIDLDDDLWDGYN